MDSTQQQSVAPQTRPFDRSSGDGVARCARYAIGPNKLHLCGPDVGTEVFAYLRSGESDAGLTNILSQFQTLYPYLQAIAAANRIRDPFDPRVVEAYWIGNELLEQIPPKRYYDHLVDVVALKKKYPPARFQEVVDKIRQGARMHHSFHVLNLYRRTGHEQVDHTLETFAQCLVSWGEIMAIDGPTFTVRSRPLVVEGHTLVLGESVEQQVRRRLWDDDLLESANVGDTLSIHWGVPCEVLSAAQVTSLERYTRYHLALANETL